MRPACCTYAVLGAESVSWHDDTESLTGAIHTLMHSVSLVCGHHWRCEVLVTIHTTDPLANVTYLLSSACHRLEGVRLGPKPRHLAMALLHRSMPS